MTDWDAVKCTNCRTHRICRKHSAMKGSSFCQVQKGYIPPKMERYSNSSNNFFGMMLGWAKHISPKQLFLRNKEQKELEGE